MKVISTGNDYVIYDDNLKTYDKLPAKTYIVRFDQMKGFSLEEYSEIEIKENKIYGVHEKKVEKVLNAFEAFNRNLGVILSGDKGIGKSLFAKMLSKKAIEKGLPLIVVDRFVPGIASYLESIEQETIILFDEFDKTFGNIKTSDNETDPQASLLTLFDGISSGKKLFVITCNELRNLNDYLVNRPGRCHYHFRFEYPSAEEIKEYLEEKLDTAYYKEIESVIAFSKKVSLNYDCLRSIAFELNLGISFKEAIKDLNILNTSRIKYNVSLYYEDGTKLTARNQYMDLFDQDGDEYIELYDKSDLNIIDVKFNTSKCAFDMIKGMNIIQGEDIEVTYNEYEDDDAKKKETIEHLKNMKPMYLSLVRCMEKEYHYAV